MRDFHYGTRSQAMESVRRRYRDDHLPRRWPKLTLGPVLVKAAALLALLELLRISLQHFYI